jgi:hypothetical protein
VRSPHHSASTPALVGVCGCFPQAKNPMLVSDVSSFYLDDTIRQAKRVGMDYRPTLDAALDNDTRALQRLFELTSSGALEGRGADSHAAMLWTLLTQWGDRNFSKALNIEPAGTRQAVITYLDYAAAANYSKHYPLTYAMGRHEVRFSGR